MRWVALAAVVLLSGCVNLEKGAEANVPTVTCVFSFGQSCQFSSDKDLDKRHAEGDVETTIVEPLPFPPVGQHEVN